MKQVGAKVIFFMNNSKEKYAEIQNDPQTPKHVLQILQKHFFYNIHYAPNTTYSMTYSRCQSETSFTFFLEVFQCIQTLG